MSYTKVKWKWLRIDSNRHSPYETEKWLESCMGLLHKAGRPSETHHCGFVSARGFAVDITEDNSWIHPCLGSV